MCPEHLRHWRDLCARNVIMTTELLASFGTRYDEHRPHDVALIEAMTKYRDWYAELVVRIDRDGNDFEVPDLPPMGGAPLLDGQGVTCSACLHARATSNRLYCNDHETAPLPPGFRWIGGGTEYP